MSLNPNTVRNWKIKVEMLQSIESSNVHRSRNSLLFSPFLAHGFIIFKKNPEGLVCSEFDKADYERVKKTETSELKTEVFKGFCIATGLILTLSRGTDLTKNKTKQKINNC